MNSDDSPQDQPGAERRRSTRVGYGAMVMMAAYTGNTIPPLEDFQPVETRDLSPAGISFYSQRRPPSETLVLLMGNPQHHPLYVTARVAHCNEGFWNRERKFLVGCELTGRLSVEN